MAWFDTVQASTEQEAIEVSKDKFIKEWHWGIEDGKKTLETLDFYVYGKAY